MRTYVKDHSPGAYAVDVPCLACGVMVRLAETLIDPSGPAFRAYYHEGCAPAPGTVRGCNRDGCPRCSKAPRPVGGGAS